MMFAPTNRRRGLNHLQSRTRKLRPQRLLFACLLLLGMGCDDLPSGRGMHGVSPADDVAQLLKENVPFPFQFELEDIVGNKLSKADFSGKVLIVDFWGTWCPPCR